MAFSMFASAAFAADETLTTEAKFQQLKTAGIFQGINGESHLDQLMTRAEFAKALATLLKLESKPAAAASFKDVSATHWAIGQIGALAEAKIIEGVAAGQFGPKVNVSLEQIAKIAVTALKLETKADATVEGKVSDWAKPYVAAALTAGLIKTSADYTANATRGDLVDASFQVYEVTNTVVLKATEVKQSAGKTLTVSFNRALTADEQKAFTYKVVSNGVTYTVTPKFATDGKSVELTATYLAAGAYTVTANGTDFNVTVADAKLSKIEIAQTALMVTDGQPLTITALDQFGAAIDNASLNVSVFDATDSTNAGTNGALSVTGSYPDYTLNLAAQKVEKGDTIVVTATDYSTGTTATKTFTAVDASALVNFKLAAVQPLTGSTRITAGDQGLVLPYTFVDAAGVQFKLPESTPSAASTTSIAYFGDIQIVSSNPAVVDATSFRVDSTGTLKFNAKADGTVVLTALNVKSGASATTTVVINKANAVSKFTLSNPSSQAVAGEYVTLPFTAVDDLGAVIDASKFYSNSAYRNQLTILVNGATVTPSFNAKGEMQVKLTTAGTYSITALVNSIYSSAITLTVKDVPAPTTVKSNVDFATVYAVGGSDTVDLSSVKVIDGLGRTVSTLPAGYTFKVDSVPAGFTAAGNVVTANTAGSTGSVVVGLYNGATLVSKLSIPVSVIANDKVTGFEISSNSLVYAGDATPAHDVTVELKGKTGTGETVAIAQGNFLTYVTTSDPSILSVTGTTIKGVDAGKATITAYNGTTVVATQEVTVSETLPSIKTLEVSSGTLTVARGDVSSTVVGNLTAKDQYGKVIAKSGVWSSSDSSILEVNNTTGVFNAKAVGQVTLTFLSNTGVKTTFDVRVE